MNEIRDWAQRNWFEFGILLIQGALLVIVAWYGSKILKFLNAFFDYQNEFRRRLSATIDQVPRDDSGVEYVWREVKEWLQAPIGSSGGVDPLDRTIAWLQVHWSLIRKKMVCLTAYPILTRIPTMASVRLGQAIRRWQRTDGGEPLSIVLLLCKPHFFRDSELRTAAERAWGISFAGEEGSMHYVIQTGATTLMKAGPHLLNFFQYSKPYVDDPRENVSWLPQASQQQAWAKHAAYVGVDYMNRGASVELAYGVVAKLVAEMIDENCAGIYFPRESGLVPNDESLYRELQKLAPVRGAGVIFPK